MEVKEFNGYVEHSFVGDTLDEYISQIDKVKESRLAINGASGKTTLFEYLESDRKLSRNPYININFDFTILGDNYSEEELDHFIKLEYFRNIFRLLEDRGINLLNSKLAVRYFNFLSLDDNFKEYLKYKNVCNLRFPLIDYTCEFMELSKLILDIKKYFDVDSMNLTVDNFNEFDNNRMIQDKISWYFNNFDKVIISCNNKDASKLYPYSGYHIINLVYTISDIWNIVENRFEYINYNNTKAANKNGKIYDGKYYTKLEYLIGINYFEKIVKGANYNLKVIFDIFDDFFEIRYNTEAHLFNDNKVLKQCILKKISY